MKRIVSVILALAMLLSMASAVAESGTTRIDPTENRNIKINEAGLNEVAEGISPTTGLTLSDLEAPEGFAGLAVTGRYLPMMVQIDNQDGGVDNPDGANVSPWGLSYADIIYETPLYSNGPTRITAVFSDLIPTSVGPVRSARLGHAWLREEWDAGFVYYGQQEYPETDVRKEFSKLGATSKDVLYTGIVSDSKPWAKYFTARKGAIRPHQVDANVAGISELVPADHAASNHAFKFTDELPTEGDNAELITVRWVYEQNNQAALHYGSNLEYDVDSNTYFRYMRYGGDTLIPYEDRDTQQQLAFSNVIVQFIDVDYARSDAPIAYVVGDYYYKGKGDKSAEGNCDIFMGGKRIAGYWKRNDMESRTVFYGPDGNEIELQRGKTLIITCPEYTWVDYK